MSALSEIVAAVDPELAAHAVEEPGWGALERQVDDAERAFVLEAVYEAYLLHHATPRVFCGMDEDLRLLAGDALYALGLARLADGGDLDAVAELADLISLCAQAHADGRPELVDDLWAASLRALAGGDGAAGAKAAWEARA